MIGATIVAVMMGSYASVAFAPLPTPKASWTIAPLVISFTATKLVASKSASDSVSCSPSAGVVQLIAKSSSPAKLGLTATLTATPSSFFSCGSFPNSITVAASCLVSAAQCKGSYSGQVQLRQPANYRNLPDVLKVLVTVN